MKIKKVEIQAFKGYLHKKDGTFDFMIGKEPAKLIAIYAPNGYGKTSFYDAIDYAITRNVHRYIRVPSIRTLNNKLSSDQIHDSGNDFGSKMILRNTNNPDRLNTTVTVDTTIEKFFESINADKATRDYIFDPSKTPEDRKFFEKIILSQEAIDSYIRESRPEQRYIEFIACQSDEIKDLELSRIEIYQAISDLNLVKSKIEDELSILIKESMDFKEDSIVKTNFVKYQNELAELGVKLPDFSGIEEQNIKDQIEIVLDNILYMTEEVQKKKINELELINNEISKYNLEYKDSFRRIKSLSEEKEIISSNKKTYEIYQTENKKLLGEKRELDKQKELIVETSNFNEKVSSYVNTKYKVSSLVKANKDKYQRIKELSASNSKLSTLIENSKDLINGNFSYINALQSKRDGLDENYNSLDELGLHKVALVEEINIENNKLLESKLKIDGFKSQIENLKNIPFKGYYWVDDLKNLELIDINDYNHILDSRIKLNAIEKKENKHKQDVVIVEESVAELKRLQSYGLTYLSKVSNFNISNCPLCYSSFGSHTNLCEKINENEYLKDYIDPVYKEKLELKTEKESINSSINSIINKYELLVLNKVSDINTLLNNSEVESEKINSVIVKNSKKLDDVEQKIKNLYSITQGKSKEDLLRDIDRELSLFEKTQENLNATINDHSVTIINNNEESFNTKVSITNNDSSLEDINLIEDFENFLLNKLCFEESNFVNATEEEIYELLEASFTSLIKELDIKKQLVKNIEYEINTLSQNIMSYLRLSEDDAIGAFNESLTKLNESIYKEKKSVEGICAFIPKNMQDDIYRINESELYSILESNLDEKSHACEKYNKISSSIKGLLDLLESYTNYLRVLNIDEKIRDEQVELANVSSVISILDDDKSAINELLKKKIDSYFYSELVNQIYSKIDPHPGFKKVVFECTFSDHEKPKLNVYLTNEGNSSIISPNIYLSSAQISVLSLSIFMARALNSENYKNNPVDCILLDDPVQSMDSINVLSTIDLFRNLAVMFNKQIIISTHDERFYKLFKAKAPKSISKFIEFQSHGKVKTD